MARCRKLRSNLPRGPWIWTTRALTRHETPFGMVTVWFELIVLIVNLEKWRKIFCSDSKLSKLPRATAAQCLSRFFAIYAGKVAKHEFKATRDTLNGTFEHFLRVKIVKNHENLEFFGKHQLTYNEELTERKSRRHFGDDVDDTRVTKCATREMSKFMVRWDLPYEKYDSFESENSLLENAVIKKIWETLKTHKFHTPATNPRQRKPIEKLKI